MRRFPAAAVAAVVATSLIAPSAILAEQPSPEPAGNDAGVSPSPPTLAEQTVGEVKPGTGSGSEVTGVGEDDPAAAGPTLRTSVVRRASRAASASAAAASVFIKDYFFSPKTVTINVGESVKWTNKGKAPEGHTATGDSFDSGVLKEGESYVHKFTKAGSFDYICTLHANMKGTVVVKTADGGGGSGGGDGAGGSRSDGGSGGSGGRSGGSGGGSTETGRSSDLGGTGTSSSLPSTGQALGGLLIVGVDLLLAGTLLLLRVRLSDWR